MRTNGGMVMLFFKGDDVVISGHIFTYDLFQYLLSRFKGAFSRSSLTIEEAFKELDDLDETLNSTMDHEAHQYYSLLSHKEKKEIMSIVHQIIVFKGSRFGVFSDTLTGDQKQIDALYAKHFSYFDSYVSYYLSFDDEGNFDKRATFQKMDTLFYTLPQRRTSYHKAYAMQKDHLDAFDYAMTKKDLSVSDVVEINNIVNNSNEDKVLGFKKTNNEVLGASFTPADKTEVPFEMQKLFAEYRDDFGMQLFDPNEPGITPKEKYNRTCEILRKEAIFHIRFIRIHPFNDGNGRTGRIILNHHLLKQGVAPVILSYVMSEEYKKCIDDYDIEGLAKLFFYSSSLQLANWISEKTARSTIHKKDIQPSNDQLAELVGYEDNQDDGDKKNKIFGIGSFLL